jgi:hypothetical protein
MKGQETKRCQTFLGIGFGTWVLPNDFDLGYQRSRVFEWDLHFNLSCACRLYPESIRNKSAAGGIAVISDL